MSYKSIIMYEEYTKQALPNKEYCELLGIALCVFNSNNAFIIENILREDAGVNYDWYDLIDKTSGELSHAIKNTITKKAGTFIGKLFNDIVSKRNRIIHSFQITDKDEEQRLVTKDNANNQYVITENYLKEFIKQNELLSSELHKVRGY